MNKLKMSIDQIDNDTITTSGICTSLNDHIYITGNIQAFKGGYIFDSYFYFFYEGEWKKNYMSLDNEAESGINISGGGIPQVGVWYIKNADLSPCNKDHSHLANAIEE